MEDDHSFKLAQASPELGTAQPQLVLNISKTFLFTSVFCVYISNILVFIGIFQEYQYLVAKYDINSRRNYTNIYICLPRLYNCKDLRKLHISPFLKVLNDMGFIAFIKNKFGSSVFLFPKYSLELLNVILVVIYGF